jgi:hypothetical protein
VTGAAAANAGSTSFRPALTLGSCVEGWHMPASVRDIILLTVALVAIFLVLLLDGASL